jgi:3-mercaptopyruvate sulfurtransferase SseA
VQILSEKGITNAAALVGGTQAWEKAGYPMESSGGGNSNQNKNPGGNANTQSSPANKAVKSGNN